MKDLINKRLSKAETIEEKINVTREFLHLMILKIMFDREVFNNLAFVGGTAQRILYGLRRFSEDLNFTLIDKDNYSYTSMLSALIYEIEHYGLKVNCGEELDNSESKMCLLKFPVLLNKLGMSTVKRHEVSIKIDIDINPPEGWNTVLSPVSDSFVFAVKHYDFPSLFANKIYASFFKSYPKGRDYYDLLWYLGKKVLPNFNLLNNLIKQTHPESESVNKKDFKLFLLNRMENVNFNLMRRDIERFIEDKNELRLFDKQIVLQMVNGMEIDVIGDHKMYVRV